MRCLILVTGVVLSAGSVTAQQSSPPAAAPTPGTHAFRSGDILKVDVWGHPEFSGQFAIDESGHLQYPVVGDIDVTNLTIAALRERVRAGLDQIFKSPFVTVTPLFRMAVLGQVRNPGLYTVDPAFSVLDVVALAGGPAPAGNMNKVRLLRGGEEVRLSFARGRSLQEMGVRSGDQIVVPRKSFSRDDLSLLFGVVQMGLSIVIFVNTR
jgi:polysaccharide biosynthesis/export protein